MTDQMKMIVLGWPVLIDEIKLVNEASDIQLEWRLDVDNEFFPDINEFSAAQIEEVKEKVGEELVSAVARDVAMMAMGTEQYEAQN